MAQAKKKALVSKERTYVLKGEQKPVSYVLQSKNSKHNVLLYFDGERNRALRYSPNQKSCFVEDQDTEVILEPIIFIDGSITVPKNKPLLQDFLSNLHPGYGRIYEEYDPELNAQEEVEDEITMYEATKVVMEMDIAHLEGIARVMLKPKGTNVDKLTSSELKRDMLIEARRDPEELIRLANDPDVQLRNLAIRAVDMGLITLRDNNTNLYIGTTKSKIVGIPFGDNPYTVLASYFKTDEGIELMTSLAQKLK